MSLAQKPEISYEQTEIKGPGSRKMTASQTSASVCLELKTGEAGKNDDGIIYAHRKKLS